MSRLRNALGIAVGVVLLASAAAHSLLGWPALRASLGGVNAPADLVTGLAIGWYFIGAALLAFGLIVLATFGARLRGRAVSLAPARVIAAVYTLFGIGALAVARDPSCLVLVVPGLLLAAASAG